jgi:hypothetical protein
MSIEQADKQIELIEKELVHQPGFLGAFSVALLSGRLTAFLSLLIAGLVALVLCVFMLLHPDSSNIGGIITILGLIGAGSTGVGNITSMIHTLIAAKSNGKSTTSGAAHP